MSDGALVVDVKEETDAKEDPAVYHSKVRWRFSFTVRRILATIVWRMEDYAPDGIIYLTDKRAGAALYPGIPLCEKDGTGA